MDIVKLFRDNTELLNVENKCGFCWEFSAPFFESTNNLVQEDDACCVQLRLINYRENRVNEHTNGFLRSYYTDYHFTLQALKQSEIGINIDNEIKGYDLETSKWNTIYQPLKECLSQSAFIDWCALLGLQIEVNRWEYTLVNNYNDSNFAGWQIGVTIRIRNE